VLLGLLLGSGDQLGWPDAERDREPCDGGEGRSALGALDAADVVAVDAALKAKALLGHAEFVASVADRFAEASEEWVACGHNTARCSLTVLGSTAQPCCLSKSSRRRSRKRDTTAIDRTSDMRSHSILRRLACAARSLPTRRRLAAILAVLVLGGLYVHGTFDRTLSGVGLNFHKCARNGLGATFCGQELSEIRARLARVKIEEAAREAERTKEREAQEARTTRNERYEREVSHLREALTEDETTVAHNLELITQGRAASIPEAEKIDHEGEYKEHLLRVEIAATEAAEREP
jgi:hypothetical protein